MDRPLKMAEVVEGGEAEERKGLILPPISCDTRDAPFLERKAPPVKFVDVFASLSER